MAQFTINSAIDQGEYVTDQILGYLDAEFGIDFGDIPRGSSQIYELYIKNISQDESFLKNAYIQGLEDSDGSIYGQWSLSTTPSTKGGQPVRFRPSGEQLSIADLGVDDVVYFFMRINVSTRAIQGSTSGPSIKLKGSLE